MYTKIKGIKINYDVAGNGKPLVMLHGWGSNIENFRAIIEEFSKYFKVYAMDFPGFGQSEEPDEVWNVRQYGDFVIDFMAEMDIENPILFGHSFGGRVSIDLGSRIPVHKIVLMDSAGVKPKRSAKYYAKVYSYKTLKKIAAFPLFKPLLKEMMEDYRARAGSEDYRNASNHMKKILSVVVNEDLQHLMPKIKAPTLLVWGEADTATPVSDGEIMEKLIPDAGLVVLKGVGHYAYLENHESFVLIAKSFLKNDMSQH